MQRFFNALCASALALALLVLAGCSSSPSNAKYDIKAYSGGEVVKTFEVVNYGTGDGRIYAYDAAGRKHAVGGSFSVHRTDAGAANGNSRATRYTAELYSGGKLMETVSAYDRAGSNNYMTLSVSNSSAVIFGGTYIVRNTGINYKDMSDNAKYKVTVYSDGVVIATFFADSYSTSTGKIYLRVWGVDSAVAVAGDYVIEQFR